MAAFLHGLMLLGGVFGYLGVFTFLVVKAADASGAADKRAAMVDEEAMTQ